MNENDITTVKLVINSESANSELGKVKKNIEDLTGKLLEARKAGDNVLADIYTKDIKKAEAQMKRIETRAKTVEGVLQNLDKATPKKLKETMNAIVKELNSGNIERGSKEWKVLTEALRKCKQQLSDVNKEMSAAGSNSDRFAKWGQKWVGIVTTFSLGKDMANQIVSTARQYVQAYATMQEAEANVMKYTGMTREQVADLNEELKNMDTRTSREQLNALAGDAGRLGITSKEGILEFVDAADKINVALGEDLGEDAVKNIGKLAQMFGEDKNLGLRGAMLATGSTINAVAQSCSASEPFLVQFTARVAGAAHQAGIAQADILGFAASMDENMLREETSATAYQKILMKMYTDTEKFANAAGLELNSFSKLLKEDANEALLQFAEGLSKKGGLADLAPIFGDLKTEGAGVSTVLSVMAGKADEIRERQKLANEAYREGTSIIEEFNVQNTTVQAGLDKAKKHFAEIGITLGEQLLPIMTNGIHLTSKGMKLLSSMISFMVKYNVEILTVAASIAFYVAMINKEIIANKLRVFWEKKVVVAFKATMAASKKLWATLAANPYTALIAAVTSLTVIIARYIKRTNEAARAASALAEVQNSANKETKTEEEQIRRLLAIAKDEKRSKEERLIAIKQLNEISPEYLGNLNLEAINTDKATQAVSRYITAMRLKKKIEKAEAKREELTEGIEQDIEKQTSKTGWAKMFQRMGNTPLATLFLLNGANNLAKDVSAKQAQMAELDKNIEQWTSELISLQATTSTNTNGGGGGGGGGNPDDDAIKAAKAELKRLADIQKLQQRLLYESGQINQEQYAKAILDIDAKMYEDQRNLYSEYSAEWLELENKRLDTEKQKRKESNAWSMADIERQEKEELRALDEKYRKGEINEKQYQEELTSITVKYLRKRAEEAKKWGEDARQYEEQAEKILLDDQINKQEEFWKKVKEFREEYTKKSIDEQKADELNFLEELYKAKMVSEEEYQRFKKKIEYKYAKEEQNSKTANLGGASDDLSSGVIAIGDAIDNLNAKLLDGQADWEDYAAIAVQSLGMINAIMGAASDYMEACYNEQAAEVEARYDAEIDAAGNNKKKVKEIEAKKEAELAELKTKYNERAMKIEIAQAVASTAMSAINAYSSASAIPVIGWIMGPIAAAAALAAGALQIAAIKKQHQAEAAGYYVGGFTGGKKYKQVAGVVHEGEFVANHNAVNNPNLMPVLSLIDQAQRSNTVGSLTADDVSRSISAPLGTAAGVQAAVPSIQVVDSGQQRTAETINRLADVLESGIQSYTVLDGPDGLDAKWNKYNKLKKNKNG